MGEATTAEAQAARQQRGKRGGKGQQAGKAAQSPTHVLLRGDAELLVDSLVTAERHERHMKTRGEGDEPRFGRMLVPYFTEGATGDNLEADINHDLTDPNGARQAGSMHAAPMPPMMPPPMPPPPGRAAQGHLLMTAAPMAESPPLPVPSNLIPASFAPGLAGAPVMQQAAAGGGKKANKRKKKDAQQQQQQQQQQQLAAAANAARVLASQNINGIKGGHGPNGKAEQPQPQQKQAATARWAGPSFSNSPKPESVPLPTATLLRPRGNPPHAAPGAVDVQTNTAAAASLCRLLKIPGAAS